MRYALSTFTAIILFLCQHTAFASVEQTRSSAKWLANSAKLHISEQQDSMYFAAKQSKTMWLASGQWLEIDRDAFNSFIITSGSSKLAQQRLTLKYDFICKESVCQLPVSDSNRVVVFRNHLDDAGEINVSVGQSIRHRDSFRRSLKLPREVTRLHYGQNVEHFYHFKSGESVTLFFQEARKLKISVRKDLSHFDDSGKVYAYIDKQLSSIITTPISRSTEFEERHVGIVNNDYLAIEKGQYLTLNSQTDAYIKVEQSHRGIYDSSVMDKQKDALFQPYWSKNLSSTLEKIYLEHDLSPLNEQVYLLSDPLEKRRYLDLLSTISSNKFLAPSTENQNDAIKQQFRHFNSLSELRLVDDTLYPKLTTHYANVLTLDSNLHTFDISGVNKATSTLTLHARSQVDSKLLVTAGHKQWSLTLENNSNFLTFKLPIEHNTKKITITNLNEKRENIEYSLSVKEVLELPNNELLYAQPQALAQKSPVIAALLLAQRMQASDDYLASIAPYNGQNEHQGVADKRLNTMTFLHQLGQVEYLAESDPINALLQLKVLVNAPTPELAIKAWQLRFKVLKQQNKDTLAKSYLEGLYKSSQEPLIKLFAAKTLVAQYQALKQDYKLQGLCASAYNLVQSCPAILSQLALKQQKNMLALWLSHDYASESKTGESFSALNWRSFAVKKAPNKEYSVSYFGTKILASSAANYDAIEISEDKPLQLTAHNTPLTISIRARAKSVQNGQYKMAWLFSTVSNQQSLLPLYADIPSTTALHSTQEALSIAADAVYTLQAGETLKLTSDHNTYLTYKVLPNSLQQDFEFNSTASRHFQTHDFMALLYDYNVTMQELLTNALYKLSHKQLSLNAYTQLLSRANVTPISALLSTLYSRVKSYGEWVPFTQYTDFAGTQLISLDSIGKASYSDQLARSSTVESADEGILLRPFHNLNIDLTQTKSKQIRLNFNFSAAELSQGNVANISINMGQEKATWSVQSSKISQFGFNKSELTDNVLSLRWLNPYLSQTLTVSAEQYINNRWSPLELPNKLMFYTATKTHIVSAKLTADRLVKLEQMYGHDGQPMQRIERQFIHPAGKVEIKTDTISHVRLYQWQLSEINTKISTFEQPAIKFADKIVYQAPANSEFVSTDTNLKPEHLNWQAFVGYDQQGIFESAEGIPTRNNIDIGARFRLNDNEHWYRFDVAYSLGETQKDVWSLDGYYKWQDNQTPWYFNAALQTTWQTAKGGIQGQQAAYTYLQLGQIWTIDTAHRHQWQISPFYNYTSADLNDFLLDNDLNSDIYNFYREDHESGWRGEYSYRYQPWVDNYIDFGVSSTSNDDWTSFDNIRFSSSWNQFYHGHMLQAGISSYYRFADDDRQIDTWQYISSLAWQKQVRLGNLSEGWFKVRWEQDWFENNHNISLEFSTGNINHTGFDVFADDELIFKSLQFNHFLEQYNYDQE
jgi:hypothetical protein